MSIKKFTEIVEYDDHIKPVLDIPEDVALSLNAEELALIERQAMLEYRSSKKTLNESIADVAVHDEGALNFAGEISKRVLKLIEVAAELGLIRADDIDADETNLKKVGVSQQAIDARSPSLLAELKQKMVKSRMIKGNVSEAGFVGFSPQIIENASNGNLRERMYIPYKSMHRLIGDLFAKSENVALINQKLAEKGLGWQLNIAVINELNAHTASMEGGLLAHGSYASSRHGSRKETTEESRREYGNNSPTIQDMELSRVPLSQREVLIQSGDLSKKSGKRIQWLPGEAWCEIIDSRDHHTVKAADETADLMLSGISGTTDNILTLGHIIGVFDAEDKDDRIRDGVVACIGWMVDAKDHTAHEILTSAKTFGVEYTASPDSYLQIRPGDKTFLDGLKEAQAARGYRMPDEYLSSQHVHELAEELFPEKMRIDVASETHDKENSSPNTLMSYKKAMADLRTIESQVTPSIKGK